MILVSESYVNETRGLQIGDTGPQESRFETPGEVYRYALKEYGRCTGKVYIDCADGNPIHVGWVFQKRKQYEDCAETYILEMWVTLHTAPDTVKRTAHYMQIKRF